MLLQNLFNSLQQACRYSVVRVFMQIFDILTSCVNKGSNKRIHLPVSTQQLLLFSSCYKCAYLFLSIFQAPMYVNCGQIKAANCQRLFSFASLNIQTNKNYPKMAPKLKLHTIFGCFYEDGMKIKMASDILPTLNISFVFRRDKKTL